jgi:ABC-2 type transport system ATP-binding protein
MEFAIETHGLTKCFGAFPAVSGLNLQVASNHVTGFLGRNGAGKSTTIKMLLGMTHPTSGSGAVLGRTITDARENREMRRRVAYVGEDKQVYSYMTVEQLIRFTASFYPDWRHDIAEELRRKYQLPANRKAKALSKGMRTKLALLLALARRPVLLILDEPSEGLDPVSIEELLQTLTGFAAEGTTVFFSSHQIAEVERIADRVCILDGGKLAADLSLDELRQDYRRITLGFTTRPPEHVFELPGVQRIESSERQVVVMARQNTNEIVERARGFDAASVDVAPVTLRELFLETVKHGE